MPNRSKKGVILFIVVGVIMVAVILTTVILRVISNQSRLTHHQISRIQAQYAAKAGMVYALEMLRTGIWTYSPNTCPDSVLGGCLVPPLAPDPDFPPSIIGKQVHVIFCEPLAICQYTSNPCTPPAGSDFCVNYSAVFTYTP